MVNHEKASEGSKETKTGSLSGSSLDHLLAQIAPDRAAEMRKIAHVVGGDPLQAFPGLAVDQKAAARHLDEKVQKDDKQAKQKQAERERTNEPTAKINGATTVPVTQRERTTSTAPVVHREGSVDTPVIHRETTVTTAPVTNRETTTTAPVIHRETTATTAPVIQHEATTGTAAVARAAAHEGTIGSGMTQAVVQTDAVLHRAGTVADAVLPHAGNATDAVLHRAGSVDATLHPADLAQRLAHGETLPVSAHAGEALRSTDGAKVVEAAKLTSTEVAVGTAAGGTALINHLSTARVEPVIAANIEVGRGGIVASGLNNETLMSHIVTRTALESSSATATAGLTAAHAGGGAVFGAGTVLEGASRSEHSIGSAGNVAGTRLESADLTAGIARHENWRAATALPIEQATGAAAFIRASESIPLLEQQHRIGATHSEGIVLSSLPAARTDAVMPASEIRGIVEAARLSDSQHQAVVPASALAAHEQVLRTAIETAVLNTIRTAGDHIIERAAGVQNLEQPLAQVRREGIADRIVAEPAVVKLEPAVAKLEPSTHTEPTVVAKLDATQVTSGLKVEAAQTTQLGARVEPTQSLPIVAKLDAPVTHEPIQPTVQTTTREVLTGHVESSVVGAQTRIAEATISAREPIVQNVRTGSEAVAAYPTVTRPTVTEGSTITVARGEAPVGDPYMVRRPTYEPTIDRTGVSRAQDWRPDTSGTVRSASVDNGPRSDTLIVTARAMVFAPSEPKYYLTGAEIALGVVMIAGAISKARDEKEATTSSAMPRTDAVQFSSTFRSTETTEQETVLEPKRINNFAKTSATSIAREQYLINPGDTLVAIAERIYRDARVAYLIAELNRSTTQQTLIDGKRIVQLFTRQMIQLPNSEDLEIFYGRNTSELKPDDLLTVVSEREFDRQLVHMVMNTAMGVREATPSYQLPLRYRIQT